MNDRRSDTAILTVPQASALSNIPEKTLKRWIKKGLVHSAPNLKHGWPIVTLAGLIESHLASELLALNYSPRKVAEVLAAVEGKDQPNYIDSMHKLVTDNVEVFIQDPSLLIRLKDGQGAFQWPGETLSPIVQIDGHVRAFDPPRAPFTRVSPGINGGRLSLVTSRVPVFAVVGSLQAGESVEGASAEYQVDEHDVQLIADDLTWFAKAA